MNSILPPFRRAADPGMQGPPNGPSAATWPTSHSPLRPHVHFVFHAGVARDQAAASDWARAMALVWGVAGRAPQRPWVDLHTGSLGVDPVALLRRSEVDPRFAIRVDRSGRLGLPQTTGTRVGVSVVRMLAGAYAASLWNQLEAGSFSHSSALHEALCCAAAEAPGLDVLADNQLRVATFRRAAERPGDWGSLSVCIPGAWTG
jgi:hypothetical protein